VNDDGKVGHNQHPVGGLGKAREEGRTAVVKQSSDAGMLLPSMLVAATCVKTVGTVQCALDVQLVCSAMHARDR